tara:strand:+ start:2353 stop:3891 length:1539 start_codon:yes stop_codon:yes gene_type:complete
LISLNNVSNHIWNKQILKDITWSTEFGQSWAIIGPNGAGKSILMKVILGQLPYFGTIKRHKKISSFEKIGNISFEQQKLIAVQAIKRDWYEDFSGKEEKFLTGSEFIDPEALNPRKLKKIAKQLNILAILDKSISKFSNGEVRKILIAKALLADPKLLILDEPFDGLDVSSSKWLKKTITQLIKSGLTLWLVSHRFDEIVPEITHILCLKSGEVFAKGTRSKILTSKTMKILFRKKNLELFNYIDLLDTNVNDKKIFKTKSTIDAQITSKYNSIIEMVNVNIRYGNKIVLKDFNWKVKKGENWKIIGPNGAGKSTLISLIYGENLKVYSNEIYLFGMRRGSGESIWDIKNKIGIVSPEIHVIYREPISTIKVVLSGFFDSIGYYKKSSKEQIVKASKWLELLEISNLSKKNFTTLSFGQQRLVLIARAMVKSPSLLILDEPCQGLDFTYRDYILEVIDKIAQTSRTQVLYITHHVSSDQLKCLNHELRFDFISEGKFKTKITKNIFRKLKNI